MSSFSLRKQDPVLFTGLAAVLLSSGLSILTSLFPIGRSGSGTHDWYVTSLLMAAGYFVILLGSGRLGKGGRGFFPFLLFLVLVLNSAYAMNRELKVVEISAGWFSVILMLICGNYIAIGIFTRIPAWIRFSLFAIAGTGICFLFTLKMIL